MIPNRRNWRYLTQGIRTLTVAINAAYFPTLAPDVNTLTFSLGGDTEYDAAGAVSGTPEPGTLALMGLTLLALSFDWAANPRVDTLSARVYPGMRQTFWLLIVLAGTSGAPWQRFDEPRPPVAPSSMARDMLAAHNAVRARVGVAPLAWSSRLAASSQDWASTLLARRKFAHRPHSTYGENLFEIRGAVSSPAQVVDAWASESRNYNHRSNKCRGVCGHYTQVIWGSTKEVGCAVARGGGREVWVCDYSPPGNWVGERPY